jgi:hypothetical protein
MMCDAEDKQYQSMCTYTFLSLLVFVFYQEEYKQRVQKYRQGMSGWVNKTDALLVRARLNGKLQLNQEPSDVFRIYNMPKQALHLPKFRSIWSTILFVGVGGQRCDVRVPGGGRP